MSPTRRTATSVLPPRKRMVRFSLGSGRLLQRIPAPWRLRTKVVVFSEKTRPAVSVPRRTMGISFVIRPLRRAPPIGGRRGGLAGLSVTAGKSLPRSNAAGERGHRRQYVGRPETNEMTPFSTGSIEPGELSTAQEALGDMIK